MKLLFHIRQFLRDEEGASMVEYGLLVALIAAVVLIALTPLGNAVQDAFCLVVDAIELETIIDVGGCPQTAGS